MSRKAFSSLSVCACVGGSGKHGLKGPDSADVTAGVHIVDIHETLGSMKTFRG